jgi:hypothetical protein
MHEHCLRALTRALSHMGNQCELSDGYDLCQGKEEFWQHSYSAADWNIVADQLATRLRNSPVRTAVRYTPNTVGLISVTYSFAR